MPHVLVAGPLHPSGREILDSAPGVSVDYVAETSEESLAAGIGPAEAVLLRTQPLTAATVAKATKLRIVSRHGVGYDAVDVDALNARGIALAVCGDIISTTVAEHAAMMILAASKRAIRADSAVRDGNWEWRNGLEAEDVRGRNLLLVGYGRIGRRTAEMMRGFGMATRAFDPYLMERGWPAGAEAEPFPGLEEGLAWADVVSLSLPHSGEALIGGKEFAAMRDGVVLVNTSRGGVIDQGALVAALASGKVAAAGIDVFETEPVPSGHPLSRFDQVILSPHIAGLTRAAAERMAAGAARNILDFFDGSIDRDLVVNWEQAHA